MRKLLERFHSGERLRDNTESRILSLMGDAAVSDRKKIAVRPVLFVFGRAGYYQGSALPMKLYRNVRRPPDLLQPRLSVAGE